MEYHLTHTDSYLSTEEMANILADSQHMCALENGQECPYRAAFNQAWNHQCVRESLFQSNIPQRLSSLGAPAEPGASPCLFELRESLVKAGTEELEWQYGL
jgi:hypothetical protein